MQMSLHRVVQAIMPNIGHVLTRFPWACAASVALTAYLLLELYDDKRLPVELRDRLPIALVAVFFWSVAAAFLAGRLGLTRVQSTGLTAGGIAAIAVLFGLADTVDLRPPLLVAGLAACVGLVSHSRSAEGIKSFWLFNHNLWIAACSAGLTAVVFAAGVSSVLYALNYLFGLYIPGWLHQKVWIIALWLIAPLNWLSLAPDPGEHSPTGEERTPIERAIALLVKFVLVPLLLSYAIILHAYAIKIVVDGSLPKGLIGWMVLSYGSALATAALLAFPTRERGGPVVQLFWRIWPWLLPVPLALLFIAVGQRIQQYGLTEGRYLVLLVGVWLTSLVFTQGFRSERRDLRLIPGLLAMLLIFAAGGPWGMLGLPANSQARELVARLNSAGVLKDGRVRAEPRANVTLLESDKRRVQEIITYLTYRGRLTLLRPVFAGQPNDPFAIARSAPDTNQSRSEYYLPPMNLTRIDDHTFQLAGDVRERLGLSRTYAFGPYGGQRYFSIFGSEPKALQMEQGRVLIGMFTGAIEGPASKLPREVRGPGGEFRIFSHLGAISLTDIATGRSAEFNLEEELKARFLKASPSELAQATPLIIKPVGGNLPAELILTNAYGRLADDTVEPTSISFWILIGN